ncbi:MAG: dinitrogenase iron-molybdenum cofactor biosynthesis protein [Clostridia bacterium]|nr:dinitrogenase iron-molybdenum cofactor biosynthesis protein [Clostridia bacterium]
MRVIVTSTGPTIDSQMDPRFGRAEYFLIIDSETMNTTAIDNASRHASGGAGIAAAQAVIDARVDVLVTGHLGPNALNVLKDTKIALYEGAQATVAENLNQLKAGQLKPVSSTGPSHLGQGGGMGQGHRGGQL